MSRMMRKAWVSLGHLFDFAPQRSIAGRRIRMLRRELSVTSPGAAISGDFRRIGQDIKIAMSKLHGKA